MKVCVIGAGASGICAAKHVQNGGFQAIVFERTSQIGGTWVYTEDTGYDEYGLPIQTSMYKSLRTNLPKEIMSYPDFLEYRGEQSYLPAEDVRKYLRLYADINHVTRSIKFKHDVTLVKPKGFGWEVSYRNLITGEDFVEDFQAVMVCNGHYNAPNMPKIKGLDGFKGQVVHSHDYRVPEKFTKKTVLVIGAGPSGMDIAFEVASEATKVLFSHHLKERPKTTFPDNVEHKPDVKEFQSDRVHFIDGTSETIDVILLCTGYIYSFPFLDPSCGITVEDNHITPLYQHMINIDYPTMCLIGIPTYVCAIPMFDIQARYFVKTLWKGFKLPSQYEMLEHSQDDFEARTKKGLRKKFAHLMGVDQNEYYQSLAEESGVVPLPSAYARIHIETGKMIVHDLSELRNYNYQLVNDEEFTYQYIGNKPELMQ